MRSGFHPSSSRHSHSHSSGHHRRDGDHHSSSPRHPETHGSSHPHRSQSRHVREILDKTSIQDYLLTPTPSEYLRDVVYHSCRDPKLGKLCSKLESVAKDLEREQYQIQTDDWTSQMNIWVRKAADYMQDMKEKTRSGPLRDDLRRLRKGFLARDDEEG